MSCESALMSTSASSWMSLTWRSTWMLPWASEFTLMLGCSASNCFCSSANGMMRLDA